MINPPSPPVNIPYIEQCDFGILHSSRQMTLILRFVYMAKGLKPRVAKMLCYAILSPLSIIIKSVLTSISEKNRKITCVSKPNCTVF